MFFSNRCSQNKTVECFPTHVRTSAMGVLAAGGRLGAVTAQFVNGSLERNIPLLLFVTSACTIVGGLTAWLLPHDTAGTVLSEEEDDSDEGGGYVTTTATSSMPTAADEEDGAFDSEDNNGGSMQRKSHHVGTVYTPLQ